MSEKSFRKCWACGALCRDEIKHYKRIENHHVWGKSNDDFTVPLCLICHDLVDRTRIYDSFQEYMKALPEISSLLKNQEDHDGRFKNLKLLMLKFLKLSIYFCKERENKLKDKQEKKDLIVNNNKDEDKSSLLS